MNYTKCFFMSILCLNLIACFEAPQDILKIGTNRWVGYEPLYLARDLGYFQERNVRLVEYPSATEVMAAFRNHLLDGAALTLDEAVSLLSTVSDVRIVLVFDISNGGDGIISQPTITSLEQLVGQRVGVENSAVGGFLLQKALDTVGLSTKDIILTPLTMDKHEAAFTSKSIDAVVTFEPTLSRLVAQGGVNIFNSQHLAEQIVDVLVVRNTELKTNPTAWKIIIQGWFQALDYIKQDKQKATEYMSIRMGSSPELVLQMLKSVTLPNVEQNHYLLGGQNPRLRQSAENLLDWMSTNGFISQQISINAVSSLPTSQILPTLTR